jgi:hypothetical protein
LLERSKRYLLRCYRRAYNALEFIKVRAWVLEILFYLVAVPAFSHLWLHSSIAQISVRDYVQYIWAIVPVLAITNALPVVAVTTFLSRYTIADRPSETIATLWNLIQGNYNRVVGHPRTSVFQRIDAYRRAVMAARTSTFQFSENGNRFYTVRPYWDGIWFYGSENYRSQTDRLVFYSAHELIFCGMQLLQVVAVFRRSRLTTISKTGATGATQGSRWFLEKFAQYDHLYRTHNASITLGCRANHFSCR